RYLTQASRELSSSLDLDVTLRRTVELAVPSIADSAALHLWEGDDLRLVALRHASPEGEKAMRALSTMAGDVAVDPMMLATALAIENARAHEARIRMADTLQRSLLPPALASVPGVEVAAFYRPMGEGVVGGDFYDLFALHEPDGAWGLVVGDVSGKGVEAAAL